VAAGVGLGGSAAASRRRLDVMGADYSQPAIRGWPGFHPGGDHSSCSANPGVAPAVGWAKDFPGRCNRFFFLHSCWRADRGSNAAKDLVRAWVREWWSSMFTPVFFFRIVRRRVRPPPGLCPNGRPIEAFKRRPWAGTLLATLALDSPAPPSSQERGLVLEQPPGT